MLGVRVPPGLPFNLNETWPLSRQSYRKKGIVELTRASETARRVLGSMVRDCIDGQDKGNYGKNSTVSKRSKD